MPLVHPKIDDVVVRVDFILRLLLLLSLLLLLDVRTEDVFEPTDSSELVLWKDGKDALMLLFAATSRARPRKSKLGKLFTNLCEYAE